ncbi:MAG TPA: MFS transporter, partial [Longimicrobium sp.]|nr:MFS transporter [Longimicrobium sp.]
MEAPPVSRSAPSAPAPPHPRPRPGAPGIAAGGRSPLAIVFVTVLLDLVGFGIVIPLLPLYAQGFGAGPVTVAGLLAIYSAMQFLFAPWWGRVSDRVGRRPVLLVGLFGSALSYALCGVAGGVLTLMAARALGGFMGANVGVAQAYVADVTPPEGRARAMGMIGAAFGAGFVLGPALGGALVGFGVAAPFMAAAALALANALLAIRFLPESLPPEARDAVVPTQGLGARLRLLAGGTPHRLRGPYAAAFLLTLAFAAAEATLSLWADRRWQLGPREVSFLFAYLGVISIVAQGFGVGRLTRRLGERRTAMLGLGILAAGMAGLAVAPSLAMLGIALAALAFGQGTASPALSSWVSRSGGAGEQGKLLGVYQSLGALGRVVGPMGGGIMFAQLGISAPYLAG